MARYSLGLRGSAGTKQCSYQLLSWTFSPSGAPSLTTILPVTHVTVNDIHRTKRKIFQLSQPNWPIRHWDTKLQLKCDKTADVIVRSPLNRHEAWTYYFAIFLTCVGYPLASCHFPSNALDKVQRRAMSNIIAKCGFNRHTKREEVIY